MRRVKTVSGATLWEHSERYYVRVEEYLPLAQSSHQSEVLRALMLDTTERDELTADNDGDGT